MLQEAINLFANVVYVHGLFQLVRAAPNYATAGHYLDDEYIDDLLPVCMTTGLRYGKVWIKFDDEAGHALVIHNSGGDDLFRFEALPPQPSDEFEPASEELAERMIHLVIDSWVNIPPDERPERQITVP